MDNSEKQEIAAEVMSEMVKQEAVDAFRKDLQLAGASEEATKDLLNRVDISTLKFMGTTRPVIRDVNGQVMQSEDLINNLKEQLPSYFGESITGNANGEVAQLSEHYLVSILKGIEAGEIIELDDSQKEALRAGINSLTEKEGGISIKKIGDYSAMQAYKLCKAVGGLI